MILICVALGGLFFVWLKAVGGPEYLREHYGFEMAVAIVPIIAVVAVSPFPSELVAIATGSVFGFWLGSLLNWMGWMMAAFLQYGLARRTAKDFDFDAARARLPRWLRDLPAHHPLFLIPARWFPWGPHLVNTAAGVYSVSLIRHGWCAAISIVPQALFISAVANGIVSW